MNTAIVTHQNFLNHLTGYRHPEQPERISSILEALHDAGLMRMDNTLHPQPAPLFQIQRCHSEAYIRLVEAECLKTQEEGIVDGSATLSTGDVQICPESYETARLAVGAGLLAVDAVMEEGFRRAFGVLRPPGHHASRDKGMGFCLFNNIAIAARYAQAKYKLERVLIVDWDVHHGNGTQAIVDEDPSVGYFSTHRAHFFPPGCGLEDQRGIAGHCLNIPIEASPAARDEVLHAFSVALPAHAERIQPQLILVSAGFDAHALDPLGGFNLLSEDFGHLTRLVLEVAERYCEGRVVSLLEGGYHLQALADSCIHHVNALCERAST